MTPADFRAARLRWGFTQKQMGVLMEITAHSVYRIEAGQRPPPSRYERLMMAMLRGDRPDDWPSG